MCVKNATQTHLLSMRDVNKGDNERVEVRSRLVGREIKQKGLTATSQEHHRQHSCVT